MSWVGGAEWFGGRVGPMAEDSRRPEGAIDCRIDPMSDHWPLLVAEPLDGERLVNSQLCRSPSGSCVHHIRNKFTAADDTPERRHVSTHVWDLPEFPRDVLEVDSFRGPGLTTRSHSTSVARQSAGWGSSQ